MRPAGNSANVKPPSPSWKRILSSGAAFSRAPLPPHALPPRFLASRRISHPGFRRAPAPLLASGPLSRRRSLCARLLRRRHPAAPRVATAVLLRRAHPVRALVGPVLRPPLPQASPWVILLCSAPVRSTTRAFPLTVVSFG